MRRLRGLAEVSVLVLCCAYVFTTALGSTLNHNEQMYVAAARLWWDHRLYADYAFLQAPLLPMINGVLFALAGQDQLVWIARLHVAFWALVAVGSVYALGRHLCDGDRAVGMSAGIAVASHALFLKNAAESSNYMMPLALAVLSLLAQRMSLCAQPSRAATAYAAVSGLAMGFAVSCKSYYAMLAFGLLATTRILGRRSRLGPWLIGFGVGALPLLYYAVRDPTTFYFGNLGYHVANTEYRRITSSKLPMTLRGKLAYSAALWRDPLLIALTLYAVVGVGFSRHLVPAGSSRLPLFGTVCLLFALSCCAALIPTPIFINYFGMPCVFLVIVGLAAASFRGGWWRRAFVVICCGAVVSAPATHQLGAAFALDLVPERLEREAAKLRSLIGCSRATYVATLSPIIPLEAGCAIYPEFASGPFAFRVADQHPLHVQARLRIVGAGRLGSFLAARRPSAILVGFEPTLDPHFVSYARAHGYVESGTRIRRRGRVWRPSQDLAIAVR